MALTYAAAGAAFVLAFKQAPQAFFQQPWIIILFALLFIALAFAMFGAYTLQLPSALQTRLTRRQQPAEIRHATSAHSSWARCPRWWSPHALLRLSSPHSQ